ncbi:MAG: DsbE family thiol:disulfide interchange protein [Caulobacteraceae bacterium]
MTRAAAFIPLLALLALLAVFGFYSLRHDPQVVPMAMVGKPVPDLALDPLAGGGALRLPTLADGPTLINFYASWCAPCAQEAPALMALKDEGVRIIGIDYKDRREAASDFLARYGDPYAAVLADPSGRAGIEFGVTGVPETYAIDRQGVIRGKRADPITAAGAESLLAKAGS